MSDPTTCLVTPTLPTEEKTSLGGKLQDILDKIGSMTDPGTIMLYFLEKIPGVHTAIDRVEKTVSGDWEATLLASDAAKHLAEYNEALAQAIKDALSAVLDNWEGNAADAAAAYFHDFADKVYDNSDTLTNASFQFACVAEGMEAIAEELDTGLAHVIDIALKGLAEFAAGFALGFVTAGAADAVAGLLETDNVYDIIMEFERLGQALDRADRLISDFEKFAAKIKKLQSRVKDFRELEKLDSYDKMAKSLLKAQGVAGAIGALGLFANVNEDPMAEQPVYQDAEAGQ